ncbi:MAG: hypothetical protein WAW06_07510 [bacterium]
MTSAVRAAALVAAATLGAALAAALWWPEPARASGSGSVETGQIVLSDRWDMPVTLSAIPAGKPTLVMVCDPSQIRCREAAVYFDAQAERIAARKIRPACILVAPREEAASAAQKMGLAVPFYVDSSGSVVSRLLGQQVLPALLLLDGKGRVVRVATGGGEALEGNVALMLESRAGRGRWIVAALAAVALVALALLAAN